MSSSIKTQDPAWVKKIKKSPNYPKYLKMMKYFCFGFLFLSMIGVVYFSYDLYYKWTHIDEFVEQKFYVICMGTKEKVWFNKTDPEYVCAQLNPFLAEEEVMNDALGEYFDSNNFTYQTYGEFEK